MSHMGCLTLSWHLYPKMRNWKLNRRGGVAPTSPCILKWGIESSPHGSTARSNTVYPKMRNWKIIVYLNTTLIRRILKWGIESDDPWTFRYWNDSILKWGIESYYDLQKSRIALESILKWGIERPPEASYTRLSNLYPKMRNWKTGGARGSAATLPSILKWGIER